MTQAMYRESPAEQMHNRILNGTAYSTRDVTARDFATVTQRAGTSALPDMRKAFLDLLSAEKKNKKK